MSVRKIRLFYRRLPAREDVFTQWLVHERADVGVTFNPATPLRDSLVIDNHVVLEAGAPAVWFTFPTRWHDIGRFHLRDGTFTGLYVNVLTPVRMQGEEWYTTDLFLDLWLPAGGSRAVVLDEDEFDAAVSAGHLSDEQIRCAQREVRQILAGVEDGSWPPAIVHQWTLERVFAEMPVGTPGATEV